MRDALQLACTCWFGAVTSKCQRGSVLGLLLLASTAQVWGAAYTVTAVHLTMETGQPVPPLIYRMSPSWPACTGQVSIRTSATASSPVGHYPIRISAGSFTCPGNTLTFVDGTLDVIPDDGMGAQINNNVSYPLGFLSGPTNPAINVTSNSIANLVGDCKTDNTEALNKLLSQYENKSCSEQPAHPTYLYFPPGCYLVTGQINPCGNGWSLWGSGPQSSYLRLAPNSPAFNTGTNVQWFNPTSVHGNDNFREFVYNLGFAVGPGNPNAIPFTTEQNNAGAERNVIIWADDSNCPYAFNLNRGYPGPALSKNMALYGCQNAIASNQNEYNWVFDQLTTEGQTGPVIKATSSHYSIQHWLSDNTGTALVESGGSSLANVALLDSELLNGASKSAGLTNGPVGNVLYVKNVKLIGYNPSLADNGTEKPVILTGDLKEHWTGEAKTLFDRAHPPASLSLPDRETPVPNEPPAATWTKLDSNLPGWPMQIANSRSTTVYAPPGTYTGSGTITITVPDTVNHLQFYNSLDVNQNPQFVFKIAGSSLTPLIIEGCVYAVCHIVHTGTRTVVLLDSYLNNYESSDGAGDVFIEDSVVTGGKIADVTPTFRASQSVWARQLNIENKNAPELTCTGCNLWILGYKTENLPDKAPSITCDHGGKIEQYGFFYYPLRPTAGGTAAMYLKDCSMFATGFQFNTIQGRSWQYWVSETQRGTTQNLPTPGTNSAVLNMHYSFGAAGVAPAAKSKNPR